MGNKYGPRIIDDGLVFCLDAAGGNKTYPIDGLDVEYLIVAGGGGGGGVIGGGGGAGGLLNGAHTAILANGTYAVVVGAGGAGGTGWNTSSQDGKVGGDSSVFSITSSGGGGGVHHAGATSATNRNGGSGGGGALPYSGVGGTGISGQGNNGGNNGNGSFGAGGGGAGSVGGNKNGLYGGNGGLGKYFGNKFGNAGYNGWFADGGSGGVRSYGGPIDAGVATNGGGNGTRTTTVAGNGSTNTGSGGGGGGFSASSNNRIGGNGGSGIVLIRYSGPPRAKGGDSIISHNGYTIHVFNSSGNFILGETAADLSSSKKNCTLTNMSTSDYVNRSYFAFDGSNQYIVIPNNIGLSPGAITCECVFKFDTIGSKNTLFSLNYNNASSGYLIRQITAYQIIVYSDHGTETNITSTSTIAANTIYHLAVTQNNGVCTIYLNGVQNKQAALTNPVLNTSYESNIGRRGTPAGAYLDGNVYFSKIYNRVLSADEILNNFNAIRGRYGL